MVCSMTAFGRISEETGTGHFTWEIRSVNHRYLELHFRLPDAFRDLEPALREQIRKHIARGKLEIALRYVSPEQQSTLEIDEALVQQINYAADRIHAIIGPGNALSALDILNMPGVMKTATIDSKAIRTQALSLFDSALQHLKDARQREGTELAELIRHRLSAMRSIIPAVKNNMQAALHLQKQMLKARIEELVAQPDNDRIEQELVFLAQKADVDEELDRLNTHIQEVERILQQDEPIGRRLDFMMQELNREANTLSSKSLSTEITQAAVDLKVLIEQMREQVQNIQ